MSYDITTDVGKVRLAIGDTNESDEVFTNTEIEYFLTTQSDNIDLAAAQAARAWAAKYTTSADAEKIGEYSYSVKAVAKLLKLAETLEVKDASTPYQTYGSFNLTGIEDTTIED